MQVPLDVCNHVPAGLLGDYPLALATCRNHAVGRAITPLWVRGAMFTSIKDSSLNPNPKPDRLLTSWQGPATSGMPGMLPSSQSSWKGCRGRGGQDEYGTDGGDHRISYIGQLWHCRPSTSIVPCHVLCVPPSPLLPASPVSAQHPN